MPNSKTLSRVLSRGALFLLPLVLFATWLEWGLSKMPTAMSQKRAGLEARASQIELLVLGGSEAYQGISPDLLGLKGYNLANVGQDLYYDQALFNLVKNKLCHLKIVLIGLSYPSFEYRLPESPEAWRQFQYAQVWGLKPESRSAQWDLRRVSALALVEPWPALKAALNGFKADESVIQADGWQVLEPLGEAEQDLRLNSLTARNRARYHESLLDPQRSQPGRLQLKSLVEAIENAGAVPILLTLPVTQDYKKAINLDRMASLRQTAREIARDSKSQYWDFFQDPHFNDTDFSDPDHLSRNGSAKLAGLLKPLIQHSLPGRQSR